MGHGRAACGVRRGGGRGRGRARRLSALLGAGRRRTGARLGGGRRTRVRARRSAVGCGPATYDLLKKLGLGAPLLTMALSFTKWT
jgi:hypothetical protein